MKKLLLPFMVVATLTLMPELVVGQIVLNADIWYDETSNTVYAYNEAYTTYTLDFYYEAQVLAQIYGDGEFLDDTLVVTSGSYALALVSVPAEPDTDYFLNGSLYGCMYYWQVIYPYIYYYDYFNFAWTIQHDPCFDLVCTVCDGPGPPVWIPMVACGAVAGVWDELHTGCQGTPPTCQQYDESCNIVNEPLCTACTTGNVCTGQGDCANKYSIVPQIHSQLTDVASRGTFGILCDPGECGVSEIWNITEIDTACDGLDLVGGVLSEANSSLSSTCLGSFDPPSNSVYCSVNTSPTGISSCPDAYSYCMPIEQIPQNGCNLSYNQQYYFMGYSISSHIPTYTYIHCESPQESGTFNRN